VLVVVAADAVELAATFVAKELEAIPAITELRVGMDVVVEEEEEEE